MGRLRCRWGTASRGAPLGSYVEHRSSNPFKGDRLSPPFPGMHVAIRNIAALLSSSKEIGSQHASLGRVKDEFPDAIEREACGPVQWSPARRVAVPVDGVSASQGSPARRMFVFSEGNNKQFHAPIRVCPVRRGLFQ